MKKPDVSRTIVTTTIECAEVVIENGDVKTSPLSHIVKTSTTPLTDKRIEKALKEAYPHAKCIVTNVTHTSEVLGMDLETFVKNAKPYIRPKSQQPKTN